MLNNKGQSLILFIILLPILLLIMILVIDIGKVIVLKQELNNITDIVLDYGLSNLDKDNLDEELIEIVSLNKDDIDDIDIEIKDNKIYLKMSERIDGTLSKLIDVSMFNVNVSYVGYLDNNEKRIEKTGG